MPPAFRVPINDPDYLSEVRYLEIAILDHTSPLSDRNYFDQHDLLISATRYYIGRKTIQTGHHARQLAKAWPYLPENTRTIIRRDLEEAFKRDDFAREHGKEFLPLGHDCDRAAWEKVRDAWESEE